MKQSDFTRTIYLQNIYIFSSYLTENKMHPHYNDQSVTGVPRNNR
jgi:hypothetical protein